MYIDVRIQTEDFSCDAENASLRGNSQAIGAVANFTGYVRAEDGDTTVAALELEHYPGMTEKAITGIVQQAAKRWQLLACTVIHRVGMLHAGEQIVFVAVGSSHRGDSFAACEFIMDYLKSQAPIWKKEMTSDGDSWVEARDTDQQRAERW
jgi:molybdopterin synthase catalytic subunit